MRPILVAGVLASSALTAGCAYFNTMYNARRSFADAQKAAARGDRAAAQAAYRQAIDKAAVNVQRHPRSRWRDDARLLGARASLQLGDQLEARALLEELLANQPDDTHRAAAHMYLGIIAAELGDDVQGLTRLNEALQQGQLPADVRGEGLLARARIHFRAQRWQDASTDSRAARQAGGDEVLLPAILLDLRTALLLRDSTATRASWNALLHDSQGQRWPDSMQALATESASTFSPAFAADVLAPAERAPWRASARDSARLLRAQLILWSGDTAAAVASADRLASRTSGAMADAARVHAAEWKLANVAQLQELTAVRQDLLPALANDRARSLVQSLKVVEVLTEGHRITDQPLSLFAAAEIARDELRSPALAARLFLTYADLAGPSEWAPKARLAASALSDSAEDAWNPSEQGNAANPYVAALTGRDDPAAFQRAEERLARALQAILFEARRQAAQRETSVNRAVAVIDSVRVAARNDSTRLACGLLLDSLAVTGIRADSMRVACVRGDRLRVDSLFKADTLTLRDSTRIKLDGLEPPLRVRRDTIRTP